MVITLHKGDTVESRVTTDTYEVPQVLGSFSARDILGAADGVAPAGSVFELPA
jgi:hypothetical protein